MVATNAGDANLEVNACPRTEARENHSPQHSPHRPPMHGQPMRRGSSLTQRRDPIEVNAVVFAVEPLRCLKASTGMRLGRVKPTVRRPGDGCVCQATSYHAQPLLCWSKLLT